MPDLFSAVRAEALFASNLQSSDMPDPEAVRDAVATALRRLGVRGCAAQVAGEFGDHPETAVMRMAWAIATVGTVYPSRCATARSTLRLVDHRPAELTLAS
jgi:hypothetical protein